MADWRALLDTRGVLIADGAWGTEFARLGLAPGEAPERLNLERPDLVRNVAASYVEAGADIILTNTFGGNLLKLDRVGLGDRVSEVNRLGAELSKTAAGDRALVFASVGPTGKLMEPLGEVSREAMVGAFAPQVAGLAAGGADGIVIESMSDLGEAMAALQAVRDHTDLPVVVSMTYQHGPGGHATIMGVRPDRAAAELEDAGVDIVGANCGQGIEQFVAVAEAMRSATGLPVWIKPNAGLPELLDGETVYGESPELMASHLRALMDAGASIVGGCCGTTAEYICRLVEERDRQVGDRRTGTGHPQ